MVNSESLSSIAYVLYVQLLHSRRGANRAQCTHLVVIDPEHTHVPTPAATGGTGYFCVSKAEAVKGNTALSTVEMLTRRGICAAELRFSTHKWGGLVRIPGKTEDGEWEIQSERLKGVSEHTGDFRRVDMRYVFSPVIPPCVD